MWCEMFGKNVAFFVCLFVLTCLVKNECLHVCLLVFIWAVTFSKPGSLFPENFSAFRTLDLRQQLSNERLMIKHRGLRVER